MPIHVDHLTSDDPFLVKPDTNEHEALRFLVAHREYGFTPSEIADHTDINGSSASKTMLRLFDKGLVERSDGAYYVAPDRVDTLERRLESLDSAIQLFESTPTDDVYAEEGWEDKLPSIDPNAEADTTKQESSPSVENQAKDVIADLEDSQRKNN